MAKVYKVASVPCNNLPKIYGFIEISDLEIILNTCNIIEIPPKPNKKAQIINIYNPVKN